MTDDKHKPDEGHGLDEVDLTQDLEIQNAEEANAVKGGALSTEDDVPAPGVKLNHSERVLP